MPRILTACLIAAIPFAASAETPSVVTDIKPVDLLTRQIMQGAGQPVVLIDGATSPHDYAFRPSDAQALSSADLVIWVGESLTPWLEDPLETLATDAHVLELMSVDGIHVRSFEDEDGEHEDHADGQHDHADDDHDEHEHAEHDHDAHEDDAHADGGDGHEEHAKDSHGHAHGGHDHSGADPHAWLDPANAILWTRAITEELAEHDPEQADLYRTNAAALISQIEAADTQAAQTLAQAHAKPLIFLHDAFGYFTDHYGLTTLGTVSESDAADPSPARMRSLREMVRAENVACAFAEPQFDAAPLETALEGTNVGVGRLDPLGASDAISSYPDLLRDLANGIRTCLDQAS